MCVNHVVVYLFWEISDNARDVTEVNQNAELEEASEATEIYAPVKEESENMQSPSGVSTGLRPEVGSNAAQRE